MDAKPNDRARVLIHGDQDPVSPQRRRLAAEQIDTPETVLHVTQENQPMRTAGIRLWSVLGGQDVSDKVFINGDAEGQGETCNAESIAGRIRRSRLANAPKWEQKKPES